MTAYGKDVRIAVLESRVEQAEKDAKYWRDKYFNELRDTVRDDFRRYMEKPKGAY